MFTAGTQYSPQLATPYAYTYANVPVYQAQAIASPVNQGLGVSPGLSAEQQSGVPSGTVSAQTKKTAGGIGSIIGQLGQGLGGAVASSAPRTPQASGPPEVTLATPLRYAPPPIQFAHITPYG